MRTLTSYTRSLSEEEAATLKKCLQSRHFEFRDVPHARYAANKDQVSVVLYNRGKLVVQGKGTREFVEFLLEPEVLKRAELGYEAALNPDYHASRIGVDESGKGDFFGPLCIAGAYVNEDILIKWEASEIRDSKRISSDKRVAALARVIRDTPGCVTSVVAIGNEAYNRLYNQMGNVNAVLAWGHARVIENLLEQSGRMKTPPRYAISDQFAATKETVLRALLARGRELELVQKHKAESDPAVAAASILARDEFVRRLCDLEVRLGVSLPKGAGKDVDEAARRIVQQKGADALAVASKLHFRNSLRARGLPEPKRKIWRRNHGGAA